MDGEWFSIADRVDAGAREPTLLSVEFLCITDLCVTFICSCTVRCSHEERVNAP